MIRVAAHIACGITGSLRHRACETFQQEECRAIQRANRFKEKKSPVSSRTLRGSPTSIEQGSPSFVRQAELIHPTRDNCDLIEKRMAQRFASTIHRTFLYNHDASLDLNSHYC